MSDLKTQILTELSFTDLDDLHLVRRLAVGINALKRELKALEKDGKIKRVRRQDEEVWELVSEPDVGA